MKKVKLIFLVVLTHLILSACASTTKEGIPFTLLEDKKSREAITFYRDFMAAATISSLENIRQGKPGDAVRLQHYMIDKTIVEISSNLEGYSEKERKIAARILDNIHDHYVKHPRSKSKWYKALDDEKKRFYESVDAGLADALLKVGAQLPGGKPEEDDHMIPVLIFRSYMAGVAVELIENFYKAHENELLKDLEYVLDYLVNEVRLHARKRRRDLKDEGFRSLAFGILTKIAAYRQKYPRDFDKWYLALPLWERKDCEKLDNLLKIASSSHQIYTWDFLLNLEKI
ncbi:MAG: hypothetical protein OEV42_06540 [Deltaproteobacteria bacterium]|nr:hypothetical protein [Deltaproteobacteria bacterium]